MLELTKEQIEKVIERQTYIENEILGSDKESAEYIMEYHGGQSKFYKKWLWDWLSLRDYASDETEPSGEVLELNMEGDEHGN